MAEILHTVDLEATPRAAYEVLTTEAGLAGWWTRTVQAEERVGGRIAFTFEDPFHPIMEITRLEPPAVVGWRCVGGHDPWLDSEFRFEIVPRGEGCVLRFRQGYGREPDEETLGRYAFNWGFYLESLRRLVETGHGTPFPVAEPADLRRVVERFVEAYKNRHDPDIVDELVAEDCAVHIPLPGLPDGREGLRVNGRAICGAFPDVRVEREFFVVEGDIVVERAHAVATHRGELLGIPPTGRAVRWTELHAYRVEDGRITEVWSEADFAGILAQIGAAPPVGGVGGG